MSPDILVVGSSNTDMVIQADHLPAHGETVLGGRFFMNAGGKGANQAVAAARLGARVTFICKTGEDMFGRQALQLFAEEGIDTAYAVVDPDHPSGVALITVDKNGENCIVVASGANAALGENDLSTDLIARARVVLLQLEIPLPTVEFVASTATAARVILNPAPACTLPDSLFSHISVITPNKTEAQMLSGVTITDLDSAKATARVLSGKGVETVIVTLGSEGALVYDEGIFTLVPAIPVTAADTTAAGDVFNGALAVALAKQETVLAATEFACRAAAISVTRFGAQASAPYIYELL